MLDRVGQFTGDAAGATKRGAASAALRAEVALLEGRLAALTKEEAALATRQTTAHDVGATVARRRQLKEEIRATQAEIDSKLAKVSALRRSKAEAAKIATTTARAAARRAACAGCLQFFAAVVILLAAAAGAAYEFGLGRCRPFDRDRLLDGHDAIRAADHGESLRRLAHRRRRVRRRSPTAEAARWRQRAHRRPVAGGSDEAVDGHVRRLYEHKPTSRRLVLLVLVIGFGCCKAPSSAATPSAATSRRVRRRCATSASRRSASSSSSPSRWHRLRRRLAHRAPARGGQPTCKTQDDGPSYRTRYRAPRPPRLDDPRLMLILWRVPVLLPLSRRRRRMR